MPDARTPDARTPAPGPWLVLGRAGMLGAAGLGSGVASHLAGGGRLPSAVVMAALLVASVMLSTCWLRTWASARRIVPVVVIAQGGWHLVLSLVAGHAGDPRTATAAAPTVVPDLGNGRRTGSLHDAYLATVPVPPRGAGGPGVLDHQLAHLGEQGLAMVLAHLVGAVALGLVLARGEATLRFLVGLVADAVGAALHAGREVSVPGTSTQSSAPTSQCGAPSGRLSRDTVRHRGPPLLLVA